MNTTQWTSTDNIPPGHTLTAGLDAAGHLHILHVDADGQIVGSLHLSKAKPEPSAPDDTAAATMLTELQNAGMG